MEQRISFITLGVADLVRSEAFYRALGWTRSSYSKEGFISFFQLNGIVFGLFPRADLAAEAGMPDTPPAGFSGITLSHNVRREDEVQEVVDQAVRAGGALLKAPARMSWGGLVAYFADPDGHLWEVCHNPDATIDAAGAVWLPN